MQVTEEDAVYDVVDEKEYAERVKGRVEEGFIVDDDGEYVEDGRYCNTFQLLFDLRRIYQSSKFNCGCDPLKSPIKNNF